MERRFWEIDFLRGLAIVGMILFHFMWNLQYLGLGEMDLYSGGLLIFALSIGTAFLFLVGISLAVSSSRVRGTLTRREMWRKFSVRGMKIFALGLMISFVTWIFLGDRLVVFGVLHCIGLSIILAIPFLSLRMPNILLGGALISLGLLFNGMIAQGPWLVWLGLEPAGFVSLDYFPLLPWFGVVLAGLGVGNCIYTAQGRKARLPELGHLPVLSPICTMGRHSLVIYLAHQPLLLGAMLALLLFSV